MHRLLRVFGLSSVLFLTAFCFTAAGAQQTADQPADKQQLIQLIKQEIMHELLEGELLCVQIELGMQEDIKTQQQVQVAACAEKERIANEKR